MPRKPDLADVLLDAHVAFLIKELSGKGLRAWVERTVDGTLEDAASLTLEATVGRDLVKATARIYASELDLQGGIPELVGDIARALHRHQIHEQTTLGELITERAFDEMLEKALEMRPLRERIVRAALESEVYTAFVSDQLYHGIHGWLNDNPVTQSVPGAKTAMKLGRSMLNRASPSLERAMDERLHQYLDRSVSVTARVGERFLLDVEDDTLRDAAKRIWKRLRTLPVSALRDEIAEDDVEDWFVVGYEHWHELRQTDFYCELIDAGIDVFYDKYGDATLTELLEDLGITREMMLAEAMRYGPPVLKMLKKRKLLDQVLRRQLEPFYRSQAFADVIAAE
jgi:hypothetical protein